MGYLIRSRHTAVLAYVLVDSYLFTLHTAFLLMQWVDCDTHAFGARGIGLVLLGHRLRRRRAEQCDLVSAG